jgi:hypothetical protein
MSTIGLVAARTGLRASAIRYYEAQGFVVVPTIRDAGRLDSASAASISRTASWSSPPVVLAS